MVNGDPVIAELEAIKRLLVLALVKSGATQDEIADALRVSSRTIRNQFSFSKYKRQEGG
jgi:predicted transcriptional regulator